MTAWAKAHPTPFAGMRFRRKGKGRREKGEVKRTKNPPQHRGGGYIKGREIP